MPHKGIDVCGSYDKHGNVAGEQTGEIPTALRVTFKSTGATGTAVASAQRTGLGDLDGLWYHVRWDDGETMWVHSTSVQTDAQITAQRAANERSQIEQVFGLTGGELMDATWWVTVADRLGGMLAFTYWYTGVPSYVESEFPANAGTYRTVCQNETFGQVPETVTDDEGTWKVVARYRSSGETECPYQYDDDKPVYAGPFPCPLCEHEGVTDSEGKLHGHIYIGDGWAEIVYRLESPLQPGLAQLPEFATNNG